MSLVQIDRIPLGPFATNCYVVSVDGHEGCWIIDAGFMPASLIAKVRERSLKPEKILLTHAHCDHIGGLNDVRDAFPDVPVLIHPEEAAWLTDPDLNLSADFGLPVVVRAADGSLEEHQTLSLGPTSWTVLHTPGHSPGSVSFHCAESGDVISGDALFRRSIGRTDFANSDFATLEKSIRDKLYVLPEETRVWPGHEIPTTIGEERRENPFVRPA